MEYLDVMIKSMLGVLAAAAVSGVIGFAAFLFSLRRKIVSISDKVDSYDEKISVMLFTVGALFDKTFKGVENGRASKAEQLLNNMLYKIE